MVQCCCAASCARQFHNSAVICGLVWRRSLCWIVPVHLDFMRTRVRSGPPVRISCRCRRCTVERPGSLHSTRGTVICSFRLLHVPTCGTVALYSTPACRKFSHAETYLTRGPSHAQRHSRVSTKKRTSVKVADVASGEGAAERWIAAFVTCTENPVRLMCMRQLLYSNIWLGRGCCMHPRACRPAMLHMYCCF